MINKRTVRCDEEASSYSGAYVLVKIIYKIDNFVGIEQGYCVLGIKVLERGVEND